jgi:drug/metabolite transporter (DMT)-like permease
LGIPNPFAARSTDTVTDTVRGIAWMILSVTALAFVVVSGRSLKVDMDPLQLLFWRAAVGFVLISLILAPRGFRGVRTQRFGFHVVRNLFHLAAQFGVYFAFVVIPLAEVTAVEYTIPAMTALIAAVFIGEKVGIHRWVGMAMSFVGVLFVVRPGFVEVPPAMFVLFGGALCFAINNVMIKAMTKTESAETMVFNMNLIQTVVAIGPALYVWTNPEWRHVPWILGLGVAGMVAHYAMSRALALADTSVCFPLDFLRLPFIAVTAWLMWGETFSSWTVVGAAIIFGSQYYAVWQETREKKADV